MSRRAGLRLRAAVLIAAIAAPVMTAAAPEQPPLAPAEAAPDLQPGPAAAGPGRSQPAQTPGHTEIALAHMRETLSNNPNDWKDTQLELLRQFAPRKLLIGRATSSERFGLHDNTLGLSGYYPLGERTTAYAELAASDTHRVLARDSLHLQVAQSLPQGWGAIGGLRHVTYNTTLVDIADLTLERYFSDYRIALTAYPSHSQIAGSAASYRLQFSRYYGDENNVQLAIVRGVEVDKPTGVDAVLATSVCSVALFGRHWLTRDWGLGYGIGYTVQGESTRRSANVGLRYRF